MDDITKDVVDAVKPIIEEKAKQFSIENEEVKKEIQDNFNKEIKGIRDSFEQEFKSAKKDLDELGKKIDESFKSRNSVEDITKMMTLKALTRAITRTDSFSEHLREAVKNKKSFIVDFGDVAKGINVYGEASENSLTDTNIFGASDSAVAFDSLFNLLNSDEVKGVSFRDTIIFNYITVSRTSKPIITSSEIVPIPDDENNPLGYGIVKEGGKKPTQKIGITSAKYGNKKIAKHMAFSEESFDDIPQLENVIYTMLFQEFMLKREDVVMKLVDSVNPAHNGIINNSVHFDPNTVGDVVQDPSLSDVILSMANQVSLSENYSYGDSATANVCLLNPSDYLYGLVLKKDADNNLQYEMFRKLMREEFDINVIPTKIIPKGYVFVGDLKKYRFYEYKPYSVRIGWINDMFIHNQFAIVAEGRHIQFIPTWDKRALVYEQIELVKTALSNGPVQP